MTSVTDRILADVKASPMKAAVLGIGLLVSAVVWGPRLRASMTGPAIPTAAGVTETGDAALRDPDAIRAAFIHVSKQARLLRRYADPQDPGAVAHDPFVHEGAVPIRKLEPVAATAESSPSPDDETEAKARSEEAAAAAALRLTGSASFGRTPMAIVNGELVRVGDRIGTFTVVEIGERSARVRGAHDTYALVIPTEEKKS
ncbi:MAG: hypothetical protein IPH13_10515 [Planctomycetes bacterium]|nr:hypothetical protein [Planctomycetota bacterium]MCC7173460.1 hypothetical protein [Planctomycetota bacterium]